MKSNIAKYFWGFNERAIEDTKKILKDPNHPKFIERLVTFLSRCDNPKELFSLMPEESFIDIWLKARNYWRRIAPKSDFRDWWQTIYEEMQREYRKKIERPKGMGSIIFSKIGRVIRERRIQKRLTQEELALKTGIRQPDISKIEKGEKNITLETLLSLCKVLDIKKVEF